MYIAARLDATYAYIIDIIYVQLIIFYRPWSLAIDRTTAAAAYCCSIHKRYAADI